MVGSATEVPGTEPPGSDGPTPAPATGPCVLRVYAPTAVVRPPITDGASPAVAEVRSRPRTPQRAEPVEPGDAPAAVTPCKPSQSHQADDAPRSAWMCGGAGASRVLQERDVPGSGAAPKPAPTQTGGPGGMSRPPAVPPIQPAPLTLDEAVRMALARNPSLEEAQAAIRRAQGGVAEAQALRNPRLDLEQRFTYQGPIPVFSFTTPAAGGQPARTQEVQFGLPFTRNLNVTGSFDVDPFGRKRTAKQAASRGVEVVRAGFFQTQNELVYAVQNLYLAALRQQALIEVAREAIEAAREQLRVADAQFRAGTAPEFDVLRASVQVANNRQTLVQAEANQRRTLTALLQLLGIEAQAIPTLAPIALPPEPEAVMELAVRRIQGRPEPGELPASLPRKPTETPPPPTPPVAQGGLPPMGPAPDSLDLALAEAFSRRPEVVRAEWNRRVAETRVRLERKGNLPGLTLAASFLFNPDQAGFAVVTKSYSLVANLTIPLWDGGVTRARTRQARAEVDQAAAAARGARLQVEEEVRRTWTDLLEAVERRKAAAANTVQAREALRIARVRYEAGIAQNVEVTDAQVALTQSRTNEVNTAYDYVNSVANLNRSLGRYAGLKAEA